MIEYVVEESVRPDGAIRWIVTDIRLGTNGNGQVWSTFSEEEALVVASSRVSTAGQVSVATRDGRHKDYGRDGVYQRIQDLRKVGVATANFNSTAAKIGSKYVSAGTANCLDCQRDISQQNPDVTKIGRIKFGALLCRACQTQRKGGVKEVQSFDRNGVITTEWLTTDGRRFAVAGAAKAHQDALDHLPNPAIGGQLNAASPSPAPTATLMGVLFIMAVGSNQGEFWWSDGDQAWIVHQNTYDAMRAGTPDSVQRQISELRRARREGRQVVKAQVTNNPRRPAATPRPRKGDLHDLRERTQALVVQIAAMSDKGPIPDGQVAELSKTYAALQAEFDAAMGEVEQVKENLSIMRAIMFEHSDPRNAAEAIA